MEIGLVEFILDVSVIVDLEYEVYLYFFRVGGVKLKSSRKIGFDIVYINIYIMLVI